MSLSGRCQCVVVFTPLLALLSVAMSVVAAQPVTVQSASVGTQPRDIVYNADALRPFVQRARTGRVDIAGIGDSNQMGEAVGWDHGYAKAWTDRYGEYATGVYGTRATGGWVEKAGYINNWGYPYGSVSTGAPAALDKYRLYADSNNDGNDFPDNYAYLGPDYMEGTSWTPMVNVYKQSGLYGQNLRWHLTYGTFDAGQGSFTPSVHSNFKGLYAGPKVSTSTGTIGLQDGAFKIPASAYATQATGDGISLGLSFPGAATMRGPFYGLWQRVEGDRQTGVSYSTTLWQGGRALVHAATALQQTSDDALKEYVRNLVKLQGGDKMLLVQVEHGQNDPGFSIPSVGPLHFGSNTPVGFADNMDAVITRMRGIWTKLGYEEKNLMFQYGPYHSADGSANDGTGRTITQRFADYENAIINLSQQHPEYNLAVVRGSRLVTPSIMKANDWFKSQTDNVHLNAAGYIGVSEMAVRQVVGYTTADELPNRSAVTSLSFKFTGDVSGELSRDDLMLYDIGSDTLLDPFDLAVDWNASTLTATWTFNGLPLGELPAGDYQAILKTSQLGGRVAGADGAIDAAGDYLFSFTASPVGIPEPGTAAGAAALVGFVFGRRSRP